MPNPSSFPHPKKSSEKDFVLFILIASELTIKQFERTIPLYFVGKIFRSFVQIKKENLLKEDYSFILNFCFLNFSVVYFVQKTNTGNIIFYDSFLCILNKIESKVQGKQMNKNRIMLRLCNPRFIINLCECCYFYSQHLTSCSFLFDFW